MKMAIGGEYYSLYTKRKWGVKKMKKENEDVISTAASLGVMIGIVFAIFLDFPVEYGISLMEYYWVRWFFTKNDKN